MIFPPSFIQARTFTATSSTDTEITTYGIKDIVSKRGDPQWWEIDFQTRLLNERRTRELNTFMDSLDGRFNTFTLPSPLTYYSNKTSMTITAVALAGSDTINVGGLDVSTIEALVISDYLTFSNHVKTYKIKSSADSDGSGNAILKIYPRLHSDVAITDTVGEGVFTLRMKSNKNTLKLDAAQRLNSLLVAAKEAL